jgi:hypothetical protein
MLVFLNAASFDNQGTSIHQSGELLLTMMQAVEGLLRIGAAPERIYRDNEVRDRPLTREGSFKHVLAALQKRIKDEEAEQLQHREARGESHEAVVSSDGFSRFLRHLTASPLAGEKFGDQPISCLYGERDVSYEATGYAAHFTRPIFEGTGGTAAVVSLKGCAAFADQWLNVVYMSDGEEDRAVWNVTTGDDVQAVRRIFEHNPKHNVAKAGKGGASVAALDLRDDEAQRLLNGAARLPQPHDGRLYARHKGRIYIFPCHEPERRAYHGYPVTPAELRSRMGDICSALYQHFGWEELKP